MTNYYPKITKAKKILIVFFTFLFLLSLFGTSFAQFNPEINYQGKLTNDLGVTVPNASYNMVFRLYSVPTGGTAIWTESRTGGNAVTTNSGLFSVMLGEVSSLVGLDFNQTLYLGVTVGGDAEMSPRKVLGAVPAAFVSQTAQLANDSLAVGGVASTSLVRNDDMGTIEASSSGTLFSLIQNGAGKIATFFAGATEVFTILNNGNVGIGTTTPAQKLSVVGNGLFTGTLTASNFSGSSVGTNTGDVTLAGENYLSLTGQQITASAINLAGTNVTGQLPYANLANGSALSVLGRGANSTGVNASITAGTDGFVLRRSGTTLAFGTLTNSSLAAGTFANITGTGALNAGSITSGFGSIDIGASTFTTIGTVSGGAGTFSSLTSPSLANAGALALSATGANIITASTNGVERLRITSAGNVGIGTTAPTAKLQVAGTSDIIQLILRNNTSQTTNLQEWQTSTGVTIASMSPTGVFRSNTGLFQGTNVAPLVVERTTAGSNIAMEFKNATASWFVGQGSNGNFGVSTSNNIGTSTLFNVTSTGNVGIGVIDPNARLTVSSNIGQLALLDANSTDTTSTGGTLIGTNDGLFTIQGVNSSGSGSAIRIAINQMNGNVGIGTTTPAQKLSVVGNGLFTGTLTASNFSGSSVGTNTGDVTLAGENYLSLTGQQITASAINLADTNVTGTLPVARGGTGITSLGTGVTTALGINIGTAGSFVTNGGALGTPSSATLTNATGLPIIAGTTGTLTIARGGTGATTAAVARTNLGATTIGANLFTLTNPSEVRFLRVNADNTVTARTADDFRSDIGVGTGSGSVTSVGLSAPTGFTVSGSPVTTSGTLALSFDTGYSLPLTASSTNWNTAFSWGNHATAGYLTATNNFSDLTNPATARTNLNVPTRTGVDASGTWGIAITGNASTATTLQTARTINGTSFNGSANITTANWGTARTLTIGGTGKSVNGSANIAWSLAEIGVDPAGTDNSTNVTLAGENYLSLTGQQITANAINLAGTNVTGTLPVARGGTGATTLTGVTIGNGTGALSAVTGTASQFLRRNAGNTAYEFATISPVLTLGTDLTGNATFTNLGNATLNATIANNAVTLAKFQQIATGSILGRNTAGTGNVEVLSTLPATVQGNITATGVLNSGSINTGFGNINIGASTFTTTGSASVGGLTVGGILNLNSASGLLARFGDSSHEDKYILFRNDFNNGTMFGYSDATISNTSGTGLIRTGSKAFAISTGDTSAFDSVTTANFVIDSTGRVGIATTTPTEMLSVVGNGLFSGSVTAPTFSGALTGNANTATTLQTARTIAISGGATGTATSFNGSANITIPITSLNAANLSGTVPNASISGTYTGLTNLTGSGDVDFARFLGNAADTATAPSFSWTGDTDTGMYRAGIDTLGLTTAGVARLTINATGVVNVPGSLTAGSFSGPLTGNASTATTLQTARTINGTSFNGSANITTANWGTARTLTIGGTGKSVNGSANIAWSLAEIGAAGEVHTHDTSDITTGTFVSARLSGSYTGITGTGALNAGSITSGFGNINIGTNTFTGNGSGLTTLNASNLSSGTVPNARISGSYTGLTNLTGSGNVDFARFLGNAADTAAAPSYSWTGDLDTGMYRPGADQIGFATGGTSRMFIDASGNVGVGTAAPVALLHLSRNLTDGERVIEFDVHRAFDIRRIGVTDGTANLVLNSRVSGNAWGVAHGGVEIVNFGTGGAVNFFQDVNTTGTFSGSGASLTALNASNLSSGTVPNARISGSYTGITGTGALNAGSINTGFGNINIGTNTFTGNGSGLTTLNASNLSSGTVPNARISGTYTGLTNLTGSGIVDFANFRGNAGDSVTVPSYSWTGNTNTGIYQPGTNQIGFTTNGVARMTINATGAVDVPGSLTAGSFSGPLTGNASTATTLQTARTINGTSFNGSANITTANWGTARTLTIGGTGKSVNGSANIAWSLAEIGAAGEVHTHDTSDITTGTFVSARLSGSYTGITGTGALNAGSITSGFGNINIGASTFTTTGTVTGGNTTVNGHLTIGPSAVAQVTIGSGDIVAGDGSGGFQFDASANDLFAQQSTANTTGVHFNIRKSRGSAASPIAVNSGDDILLLRGYGHDGTAFRESTRITLDTQGTIGAGVVPGLIRFYTTNDAGTLTQQMTIDRNGNVVVSGDLSASSFSGDGASLTALNASNLSSGTVPNARISGSYTGITGTGALNAGSINTGFGNINIGTNTFTGNGSGLTTLNASNLSSGTVPNARISGTYTGLTNLTGSGIVDFANFRGNAGDSVTVPSYSWTGNTNTGIYQPGTNQIGFTTNGVARMTINATGVVNVPGSLTLGTALAVAQGGTGALSFPAGRLLFGDGTSALNTSSGLFWDNTLSNLGIGVGSPNASLHARGLNVNEELNSIAVLDSGSSTAGVGLHIGGFRSSSTGLRHVALQVYQVGGTTVRALSLQPEGGNVGIGVTNPSARLQVDGTVTATTFSGSGASLTALNASNLSSGTVPNARISGSYTGMTNLTGSGVVDFSSFRGNASDSVTAPSFSWTGETNMGMYRPSSLSIGFSVAGINQLTITSSKVAATNGFTGDGSSLTDLDASNITSGTLLAGRLPNSWSGTKTLWNTTYFGNNTASNFYTTANINGFTTSSNNSGAVSMESGANSTNTRHHISFSNPNGVVGSIHTNNNATAYNTSSDYRLKTNATDVDNAIDRLMNLHPRRFSWVSDPTGEMIDGFFAHEVQAIIPNAVTGLYNDIDPITGNPLYQSIDHSKIIPLLTAALQDTIRQVSTTSAQVLSMTDSFTANIIHASNLEGGATTLSTDANGNIIRTPSDKRLKTNVTDINSALDTILSLRGVRYEWVDKDRFGNMTEIGFLAQEVDTVLPELVRKGGEYWTLNTPNMLAVVVEAMKEMWQSVTELSEKVAGLDKKVKTQELCIGATCVTEAQLLQLLQQQSQTSNPPPSSPTPPIVVEEGGGDEESAVVAPEEEVIEEVSVVEEGNDTGEPIA